MRKNILDAFFFWRFPKMSNSNCETWGNRSPFLHVIVWNIAIKAVIFAFISFFFSPLHCFTLTLNKSRLGISYELRTILMIQSVDWDSMKYHVIYLLFTANFDICFCTDIYGNFRYFSLLRFYCSDSRSKQATFRHTTRECKCFNSIYYGIISRWPFVWKYQEIV